jgi:membrane protease YdiL (CAAX protease family)
MNKNRWLEIPIGYFSRRPPPLIPEFRKTKQAMNATMPKRPPLAFFLLAVVLIVPFWVFGALTGLQLSPGIPVAALGTFSPMLAAMFLIHREGKRVGAVALLKRSFDFKRIEDKRWYAPILLLTPAVTILQFWVLRLMRVSLPAPQIAILPTLALCIATFIAALGEELGWSGYAIDPMQASWGALKASLILGIFWAVYHYIGLLEAHRSVEWIAWWTLFTIAARVIMVWLFNNTGKSVFGMALFHMTLNVTWYLFPIQGSFYDYRVAGLIMAFLAAILVVVWKPQMRKLSPLSTSQ